MYIYLRVAQMYLKKFNDLDANNQNAGMLLNPAQPMCYL